MTPPNRCLLIFSFLSSPSPCSSSASSCFHFCRCCWSCSCCCCCCCCCCGCGCWSIQCPQRQPTTSKPFSGSSLPAAGRSRLFLNLLCFMVIICHHQSVPRQFEVPCRQCRNYFGESSWHPWNPLKRKTKKLPVSLNLGAFAPDSALVTSKRNHGTHWWYMMLHELHQMSWRSKQK